MERSGELLRVLSDAMRSFTEATTDYRQVLDTVVEHIATLVQHHCAIRLVSPDREHLELVAHYDVDPQVRALGERVMGAASLRIDGPHLTTRVMHTGTAVVMREVNLEQLRTEVLPEIWTAMVELEVKSLLYVPLRVHREIIGVLSIARRGRNAPPIDDFDVELAQILADGAALTISNARLFAEARRQHAERRHADDALRMAEDARRFAQTIVDTVREPILVLDAQLRVRTANRAFHRMYGVTPEQIRDRSLAALPGWDQPVLHRALSDIVPRRTVVIDHPVDQDIAGLGRRRVLVSARAMDLPKSDGDAILLAVEDDGDRHRPEPARDARRAVDWQGAEAEPRQPSVAFVVIDADDPRAEQTVRMLRQQGVANEVVRARNSGEALDLLFASDTHAPRSDRPPRIALLALEPIDLAIDVLHRLQQEPLARAVPVVVLAPRAGHPTIAEARQLGATAVVIEPLAFDALARAVQPLDLSWLLLGTPR